MTDETYIHNTKYIKVFCENHVEFSDILIGWRKIIPFANLNASILDYMIKLRRRGGGLA